MYPLAFSVPVSLAAHVATFFFLLSSVPASAAVLLFFPEGFVFFCSVGVFLVSAVDSSFLDRRCHSPSAERL